MEKRHKVEVLYPEDFREGIIDSIEGHEDSFGVHESYSIGWTDSEKKDNDEGVYKVIDLLFEKAIPTPNSTHPETRESSSLVVYKDHKYLTSAGPNIIASLPALELIAEDAGVKLVRYKKS